MKSGIYAILNTANDKTYIGSAIYFNSRWSDVSVEIVWIDLMHIKENIVIGKKQYEQNH